MLADSSYLYCALRIYWDFVTSSPLDIEDLSSDILNQEVGRTALSLSHAVQSHVLFVCGVVCLLGVEALCVYTIGSIAITVVAQMTSFFNLYS